jgi:hypothetical protein
MVAALMVVTRWMCRGFRMGLWMAVTGMGWALEAATVTGFSPDRGPAGTEVTVFGSGLQTATFVYFGSTEAAGEIVARSASAVRARVPGTALTGPISVFTAGSGAASSSQIFVAAPRIESFTPTSGGPGTLITIAGANLGAGTGVGRGNVTNVTIGGARAVFQIVGLTQLKALVPTDVVIGPITVANEAGSFTSFESFQASPLLAGFSPSKGRPGDVIDVRGRNLDGTTRVEFEAVPARFIVVSRTNLLVHVPTNAVNSRLVLSSSAGSVTTASNVVVEPRILRFSPGFGAAGTEVRIEGGGFHGLTDVFFGGLRAGIVSRANTTVVVTAPNGVTNGPITLTSTNGTHVSEEFFHYPIRLSGFTPLSGRRGDTVTVDGAFLEGVDSVQINGVEAQFQRTSSTRLAVTVPSLATTGKLRLAGRSGEVLSANVYTVHPTLDGFAPASGPVGTVVFLAGSGLTNLSWVRLGGIDATFSVLNPTSVRVVVPVGAYSGPFRVRLSNGTEVEATGNFFVDGVQPAITGFSPTNGVAGTRVTIDGKGFRTASKVQFNGVEALFELVSANQLTATAPAGVSTGPLAVTTLDGVAVSSGSFRVNEVAVGLGYQLSAGRLTLRWPASAVGYVLEATSVPDPRTGWGTVDAVPERVSNEWRVSVPVEGTPGRLYRLRK